MPDPRTSKAPKGPYLALPLDETEARHLLRALLFGAAYAVRDAEPDERARARREAVAYDELRDRLLSLLTRRELELCLDQAGE